MVGDYTIVDIGCIVRLRKFSLVFPFRIFLKSMSDLPPILLLLDLSALLVSKPREWQEFTRLGNCYVPQLVYQEIQALSQIGIERNHEHTAKEFCRFFAESNWQLTGVGALHPSLQPSDGQNMSKRARLAQAVSECAYGFARNSPGRLVVLISNDQPLLKRVQSLGVANLSGVPVSAMLIWSRSGRRPPIVAQHLQAMRSNTVTVSGMTTPRRLQTSSSLPKVAPRPLREPQPKVRPVQPLYNHPSTFHQIGSGVSTLVAVAIALSIIWYIVQPKSFNQFLRQRNLPTLPEIPSMQK